MKNNRKILFVITSLLAILVIQYSKLLIGQLLADILTSLLLIIYVLVLNTIPSVLIAVLTPFVAKILGISTLPIPLLSVISLSNVAFITIYVITFQIFASSSLQQKAFTWFVSVFVSSVIKFSILHFTVDKLLIKILEINVPVTYDFGMTHLWSSLLAGLLAAALIKPIKNILRKN